MVNLIFGLFGQMANKSLLISYWEQDIMLDALGDTKEGMHNIVITLKELPVWLGGLASTGHTVVYD